MIFTILLVVFSHEKLALLGSSVGLAGLCEEHGDSAGQARRAKCSWVRVGGT